MNDTGNFGPKRISSLDDIPALRAYFNRIHAEPRSLKTAVVKEVDGIYWRDLAIIRIGRDGKIDAPEGYAPTPGEESLIAQEFIGLEWPTIVRPKTSNDLLTLPPELRNAELYFFRDPDQRLNMIQQRVVHSNNEKNYIPWTFWDDDQWRRAEPEGLLPLWGIDQLGNHTKVFIHEGAKSAAFVMAMIKNEGVLPDGTIHPWYEELKMGAHVGWIGGALNPDRTDWDQLNRSKIKTAVIIADNDAKGVSAVKRIAFHLRMPTYQIQFTDAFGESFDLGDALPDGLFAVDEKLQKATGVTRKYYIGPSFKACLSPAMWLTDAIPVGLSGKKFVYALRDHVQDEIIYVTRIKRFVFKSFPTLGMMDEAALTNYLRAFSHAKDIPDLVLRNRSKLAVDAAYIPGAKGRIVTSRVYHTAAINMFVGSYIVAQKGDEKLWLEFMTYLIPNEIERMDLLRWIATLIAKPNVRMLYGICLISKLQGIGKTTLVDRVLTPLVGQQNVSYPDEEDVNGSFTSWVAEKRLVILSEVYASKSWKFTRKIKKYMTDNTVDVNEKYMLPRKVENWAHYAASSNSFRAMKLEDGDRRWFFPAVTETHWGIANFDRWFDWIERQNGLAIILDWAENKWPTQWDAWCETHPEEQRGAYVGAGEKAPMTKVKAKVIRASEMDEALEHFEDDVRRWNTDYGSKTEPRNEENDVFRAKFFELRECADFTKVESRKKTGKWSTADIDAFAKVAKEVGCKRWGQLRRNQQLETLYMNPAAARLVARMEEEAAERVTRAKVERHAKLKQVERAKLLIMVRSKISSKEEVVRF